MKRKIFLGLLAVALIFGFIGCGNGSGGPQLQVFRGEAEGVTYVLTIIDNSSFELQVDNSVSRGTAVRDGNNWFLTPAGGGTPFTVTVSPDGITSITGEITFVGGGTHQPPSGPITPIPPDDDEEGGGGPVLVLPPLPLFLGDWERQDTSAGFISYLSFPQDGVREHRQGGDWKGELLYENQPIQIEGEYHRNIVLDPNSLQLVSDGQITLTIINNPDPWPSGMPLQATGYYSIDSYGNLVLTGFDALEIAGTWIIRQ